MKSGLYRQKRTYIFWSSQINTVIPPRIIISCVRLVLAARYRKLNNPNQLNNSLYSHGSLYLFELSMCESVYKEKVKIILYRKYQKIDYIAIKIGKRRLTVGTPFAIVYIECKVH